jgi:hypothetical protein
MVMVGHLLLIEEYFEKRVKEKIGMDFDMSYLLDRKTERKYLEALKEITL